LLKIKIVIFNLVVIQLNYDIFHLVLIMHQKFKSAQFLAESTLQNKNYSQYLNNWWIIYFD